MSSRKLQSIAIYVAIGISILLAGALGKAVGSGELPGFQDGQTFASVRGQIGDLIALLTTAGGLWIAANRPRWGSEKLAAEVNALREDGVPRSEMTVISKDDEAWLRRVKPLRDAQQQAEAQERQRG